MELEQYERMGKETEVVIIQVATRLLAGPQTGILSNLPKFQQSEVRAADEDDDLTADVPPQDRTHQ